MTKYEEIEKLQELKENGTITQAEFEVEKQKMLNNKERKNKKKDKKKIIKIVIAILISIVVIIGSFFLIKFISINAQNRKEENKIAQINSKELQEKIIKEIEKNEKINIKTGAFKTTIGTSKMINSEMLDFMVGVFEADNNLSETDEMVYAFYEGNEEVVEEENSCIYIPLFRIEANEDGSLKRIIFNAKFDYGYGVEVRNIINNVLKAEYDIDMYGGKYGSKNYKIGVETVRISTFDKNGELTNRLLAILEGRGRFRFPETPEMSSYIEMNAFGLNINK